MGDQQRPSCTHCRHYFVTWDPARPRGCRAFGFKSRELPSDLVRAESGTECQLYEPRERPRGGGTRRR